MAGSFDRKTFQAAADYASAIHRRDALRAFEGTELSEGTVLELWKARVRSPSRLTDGKWTEASMQRVLSEAAFREVKEFRRRA